MSSGVTHDGWHWRLKASVAMALALQLVLIVLGLLLGNTTQERLWNLLMCTFGIIAGWVLGTFASPYDAKERKEFGGYATLISGFLSGYLVSKVDQVFAQSLEKGLIVTSTFLAPLVLFGASLLLVMLAIALIRRYSR